MGGTMKNTTSNIAIATSIALLSACGGSGGTDDFGRDPNFGQSYVPIGAIGTANWSGSDTSNAGGNFAWFADALGTSSVTLKAPSVPTATYNGSITITEPSMSASVIPGSIYYGRMQMDVDFAGSTVSGTLGNFGKVDISTSSVNTISNVPGNATMTGNIVGGTVITGSMSGTIDGANMTAPTTASFYEHNDTGRELINGFADMSFDTRPDATGLILLSR